jgi:DNA polymerase-3 subunit gamma/tau
LLLETLLVRFALIDRTVELENVLKGFGDGGKDDPPPRRVSVESRVASAHALPPAPQAMSLQHSPRSPHHSFRPCRVPATQQVAQAAAAAQMAEPVKAPTEASAGAERRAAASARHGARTLE